MGLGLWKCQKCRCRTPEVNPDLKAVPSHTLHPYSIIPQERSSPQVPFSFTTESTSDNSGTSLRADLDDDSYSSEPRAESE